MLLLFRSVLSVAEAHIWVGMTTSVRTSYSSGFMLQKPTFEWVWQLELGSVYSEFQCCRSPHLSGYDNLQVVYQTKLLVRCRSPHLSGYDNFLLSPHIPDYWVLQKPTFEWVWQRSLFAMHLIWWVAEAHIWVGMTTLIRNFNNRHSWVAEAHIWVGMTTLIRFIFLFKVDVAEAHIWVGMTTLEATIRHAPNWLQKPTFEWVWQQIRQH